MTTQTDAPVEGTRRASADDAFTMVVTLKSGVQIRVKVTEYTVGRNGLGDLSRLRWTSAENADSALKYVQLDEIAAIHGEDLST
jgi:hypothetical protein